MKFAVNYSHPARLMFAESEIQFDLFKCPDWPELLVDPKTDCPLYFHFSLRAGKGEVETFDVDFANKALRETETQNVNIHLGPNALDFDGMADRSQSASEIKTLRESMLADIRWVSERFGKDRVILENCPWSPHSHYRIPAAVIDADFIRELVIESGCNLLLDITHALIAAKWLNIDVYEYLESLPTELIKEIHISGSRFIDGQWFDHYAMSEEDIAVTKWVFDRVKKGDWPRPGIATFEYGGIGERFEKPMEPPLLKRQTLQLFEMVSNC